MSDNVKDELADVLAHWPIGSGYYATDVDTGAAYEMAAAVIAHLAERGMVVLGPDGEPLDVRPALRALGTDAAEWASTWDRPTTPAWRATFDLYLSERNIPMPLADACLAAAEVEG